MTHQRSQSLSEEKLFGYLSIRNTVSAYKDYEVREIEVGDMLVNVFHNSFSKLGNMNVIAPSYSV